MPCVSQQNPPFTFLTYSSCEVKSCCHISKLEELREQNMSWALELPVFSAQILVHDCCMVLQKQFLNMFRGYACSVHETSIISSQTVLCYQNSQHVLELLNIQDCLCCVDKEQNFHDIQSLRLVRIEHRVIEQTGHLQGQDSHILIHKIPNLSALIQQFVT